MSERTRYCRSRVRALLGDLGDEVEAVSHSGDERLQSEAQSAERGAGLKVGH